VPSLLQLNHFPASPSAAVPPGERLLVLMLPGAHMRPQEFAENGLVERLQDLAIDVVTLDIGLDAYLAGRVAMLVHDEVVAPAVARGYPRIWMLGVSLGGMGALGYARAYPDHLEGVILLAPFLGTRGTIAEIGRAGGLAAWEPDAATQTHPDGTLLFWLKGLGADRLTRPRVHLGYGREDPYGAASRLLQDRLPPSRVVSLAGGHDWATWRRLWPMVLAATPLADGTGDRRGIA
jgi:hypothetical protein